MRKCIKDIRWVGEKSQSSLFKNASWGRNFRGECSARLVGMEKEGTWAEEIMCVKSQMWRRQKACRRPPDEHGKEQKL